MKLMKKLNKTPLKHFTEFLFEKIYRSIRYSKSAEDYIGRFYGEFMSYSGGDGQTLGIILTPKHITQLFCDLVNLKPDDVVFDPLLWYSWIFDCLQCIICLRKLMMRHKRKV